MTPDVGPWLRAVAAYGLAGSQAEMPSAPLEPGVWEQLLLHARMQRLTPLLARAATDGVLATTDHQLEEATNAANEALVQVLVLEATLVRLAAVLDAADVPFRVLKGSAVAHLDYPDPAWREFGDIDLLIRPEDLDRAIAVLAGRGFQRRFPEPRAGFDRRFAKSVSVVNADGLEIDLHRTLAPGPLGLRVRPTMLWDAPADEVAVGGRTLEALGPDERLLHACYHGALGNSPPRLVPLRDIAQLLLGKGIDPDRVLDRAKAWNGRAVVAHAITTAWNALRISDEVALSAWAAKYAPAERERRELKRALSPRYTFAAQAVDAVRVIRAPRDRLAYVAALAFPRRTYLGNRHPGFTARLRHAVTEVVGARKPPKESDD